MQFFPISFVYGALARGGKGKAGGLAAFGSRAQQGQSLWEHLDALRQQGKVDNDLWQRLTDWKAKGEDGRLALWLAQVCPHLVPQSEAFWVQHAMSGSPEGGSTERHFQDVGPGLPHHIPRGGAAEVGLWTRAGKAAQVQAKGDGAAQVQAKGDSAAQGREGAGVGSLDAEAGRDCATQAQGSIAASRTMRSSIMSPHGQKGVALEARQPHEVLPKATQGHDDPKAGAPDGLEGSGVHSGAAKARGAHEEAWQEKGVAVHGRLPASQGKGQQGGGFLEGGFGTSPMDSFGRAQSVQAGDRDRRPEDHAPAKGALRHESEAGAPMVRSSQRHAGEGPGTGGGSGHEAARSFDRDQRGLRRGQDILRGGQENLWLAPEGPAGGLWSGVENLAAAASGRSEAASIVEQTAQAMVRQLSPGVKQLTIQIEPQDLGPIHVALQVRGGEVHAMLRPAHAETSQILTNHLPVLRQELERQGFQVARLDVQAGLPDASTQGSWDGAGQHQRPAAHEEPGVLWRRSGDAVGVVRNLQNMAPEALDAAELARGAVDLFA